MSSAHPKVLLSNPSGKSVVIEHYNEAAPKRKKSTGQNVRKSKSAQTTTFQVKGSIQQNPVVETSAGPSRVPHPQLPAPILSEPAKHEDFTPSNGEEGEEKAKGKQKQVRLLLQLRPVCSPPTLVLRIPTLTFVSGRRSRLTRTYTPCTTSTPPLLFSFANFVKHRQ